GGLRAAHSLAAYVDDAAEPLWRRLIEFRGLTDAPLTFKANLLPSTVPGFCLAATQAWPALAMQAHAGSGVVVGHACGDLTVGQVFNLPAARGRLKTCPTFELRKREYGDYC